MDNTGREFHGALLDAQLLADVYLAMTGGQATLLLDQNQGATSAQQSTVRPIARENLPLAVVRASSEELAEHERHLAVIDKQSGGKTLWRTLGTPSG